MVKLRVGGEVLESLDAVRFRHLLEFARSTGKSWPTLEQLALHPEGEVATEVGALVEEMQRLAQERPPECLAPLIGLLRNDAVRAEMLSAFARPKEGH